MKTLKEQIKDRLYSLAIKHKKPAILPEMFRIVDSEVDVFVQQLQKLNDGGCWVGQNDSRKGAFNYVIELLIGKQQ